MTIKSVYFVGAGGIGMSAPVSYTHLVSGFFDKEEVPAAKFDIDKDAQIAHARIAIATSHVVGKGPGNSRMKHATAVLSRDC